MKFHSTRSIITDLGIKMGPEPEPEADRQTDRNRQTESERYRSEHNFSKLASYITFIYLHAIFKSTSKRIKDSLK